MSDHSRIELAVSGCIAVNGNQGGDGGVLAVLNEFISQIYPKLDSNIIPKLDRIIEQNEHILAAVLLLASPGGVTQDQIDAFTLKLKETNDRYQALLTSSPPNQ